MSHDADENPFDELGLDPKLSARALTEALRRRAERAPPEQRAALQRLWRRLTLKERDRARWALLAHPRASRAQVQEIETLREKIPPFVSRFKGAPLKPGVRDLLVAPPPNALSDESNPTTPLKPPFYQDRSE